MSISVVGSVGLDTVKTPFGRVDKVLGGSASYFSYAASLFTKVNLIAVVGRDFPDKFIKSFKRKGIALEGFQKKEGKTFNWSGEYGLSLADPQTLSVDLGVFADFKPKIPLEYQKSTHIFLANIDPCLQKETLSQLKTRKSQVVACDTMNFWIENKRKELVDLLRFVDIFFLNESEARQLTKEPNLLKAAKAIQSFGPKQVFIKQGEHGVLLASGNCLFNAPAYLIESVVDPTGAGDTFAGAVMGYLSWAGGRSLQSLREAAVYGMVVATFAVEGFSLESLKKASLAKVKNRIKKFRKLVSF